MKLDIGGGTNSPAGWTNVDPIHGKGIYKRRIQDGIDIGDNIIEAARASHVMEHIPSPQRIDAMNEVFRVLRPGGTFEIIVPCVGFTDHENVRGEGIGKQHFAGWQPWADPTHVSQWWYPESFWYFTGGPGGGFRANADYGICYWDEKSSEIRDGWEAAVVLVKPGG